MLSSLTYNHYLLTGFFESLLKETQKISELQKQIIIQKYSKYFDWTASGLAYLEIEKRIAQLLPYYANTHSEASSHAALIGQLYLKAKSKLKEYLELNDSFALIATGSGSTSAIKHFQQLLGLHVTPQLKKRLFSEQGNFPLIIIGPYEHHSNELSFRESPCEVIRIPINQTGHLDLNFLDHVLKQNKQREIIGSFNVASNVTGMMIPYETISKKIREYHGIVAFDMACASPYINIPCQLFDVAFYSPHKLLGGVGAPGLLAISKRLIDTTLPPSFAGGGSVEYVSRTQQFYCHDHEKREEAGTPPILQLFKATLAYQLRNEIGFETIKKCKQKLSMLLYEGLQSLEGIKIYGDFASNHMGIFSFNLKGLSPFKVAHELSYQYNIQTRAGCSCAGPYGHDLLNMPDHSQPPSFKPGWLRISIHYTHTEQDIYYLLEALQKIIKNH